MPSVQMASFLSKLPPGYGEIEKELYYYEGIS